MSLLKYLLLQVHVLTNEAEVEEKDDFYEQLQRKIDETPDCNMISSSQKASRSTRPWCLGDTGQTGVKEAEEQKLTPDMPKQSL